MTEDNESKKGFRAVIVAREEIFNYVNSIDAAKFIIAPSDNEENVNANFLRAAKVLSIEAKMLASAKKAVLQSTTWVTRDDFQTILVFSPDNAATPEGLLEDGRIFAIEVDGAKLFPFYALDPSLGFLPHKILAEIINVLGNSKNGWSAAFWFGSVSGYLGGPRPQDLLVRNPELVLAAAQSYAQGITHG
ncbi:MAG: hypothetical protein AAGC78_04885 [Cellvibrio sp.]|uniref:hypothetical protein n=1 Tax=Cellvibrio sp. TaxID=1965322 RepID=UPI0031B0ED1B